MAVRDTALIRVGHRPLDPKAVEELVEGASLGGRVTFVGAVRDRNQGKTVVEIHYEAYVAMAEQVMGEIAAEAQQQFAIERVAVHHRLGTLTVGDVAVVVAVGARHREPAFDACRYVIDQLKRRAPIWKKESYEDGEAWVSPTP